MSNPETAEFVVETTCLSWDGQRLVGFIKITATGRRGNSKTASGAARFSKAQAEAQALRYIDHNEKTYKRSRGVDVWARVLPA